jgi:hypothetical protein
MTETFSGLPRTRYARRRTPKSMICTTKTLSTRRLATDIELEAYKRPSSEAYEFIERNIKHFRVIFEKRQATAYEIFEVRLK